MSVIFNTTNNNRGIEVVHRVNANDQEIVKYSLEECVDLGIDAMDVTYQGDTEVIEGSVTIPVGRHDGREDAWAEGNQQWESELTPRTNTYGDNTDDSEDDDSIDDAYVFDTADGLEMVEVTIMLEKLSYNIFLPQWGYTLILLKAMICVALRKPQVDFSINLKQQPELRQNDIFILKHLEEISMFACGIGGKDKKKNKQKPHKQNSKKKPNNHNNNNIRPARQRYVMHRSPSSGGETSRFAKLVSDPFNPGAFGARVCDSFNFPTVTGKSHVEYQVSSGSSNYGAITIFPSPMLNCFNNPTTTQGLTIPGTTFSSNSNYSYLISRGTLSTTYDMYRVVSMGVKISTLQAPLNATGRIIVTPLPLAGTFPGYDLMNSLGELSSFYMNSTTGVTPTAAATSAMLQKPSSLEFTFADLMRGSVEFHMVPCNPALFYKFKNPGNQNPTSGAQMAITGEDYFSTTTGLVAGPNTGEFAENMSMDGGVALNILYEGVPLNISVLQVEVIVHIEGTPYINTSGPTISPGNATANAGSTESMERTVSSCTRNGMFKFIKTGLNFLSENPALTAGLTRMAVRGSMRGAARIAGY